jgi:hypothetical protein
MNWKSYAAVSGATVLAGWFASAPPSNAPAGAQSQRTRVASSPSPSEEDAATDIELQAMRLQARLRPERVYAEPSRDPFRFAPRRAPASVDDRGEPVAERSLARPVDVAPPAPIAPMVSLSGIAEDRVDGRSVRTAVLSTQTGVLLVREGEEILGYYRVGRIDGEAVELTAIGNGSARLLTLGAPTP